MAKLYKIEESGIVSKVDIAPENGNRFTLEETQAMVGGYIEVVHLDNGYILVCDEEGRLKDLMGNAPATKVARSLGFGGHDILVGNVLFCKDDEL